MYSVPDGEISGNDMFLNYTNEKQVLRFYTETVERL